jgi:hypothetical protein
VADPDDKSPPAPPEPAAGAPGASASELDDEPVPRIGRGRSRRRWSYYFPPQQVISLFALIIGLIAVLALRDSCSRGAGNFIKAFDAPPDAGAAPVPRP